MKLKNTLNTDDWVGGINALVKEMRENISKGISNTPDNLKTKLSTGGIELTWKELMNMQKTGKYIDKFLDAGGAGTYMTYANIGIARAYVHKSGLGLTEDQVKFLSEAVEKKIDRKLESSRLILELAAAVKQNPMWEGYYIGGTGAQPVASNTKMISEITEAFSKIDPNDKSTYDVAWTNLRTSCGHGRRFLQAMWQGRRPATQPLMYRIKSIIPESLSGYLEWNILGKSGLF